MANNVFESSYEEDQRNGDEVQPFDDTCAKGQQSIRKPTAMIYILQADPSIQGSPSLKKCLQQYASGSQALKRWNQRALLEGIVLSMNTSAAVANLRGRVCHTLSCSTELVVYFAARTWQDVEKEKWGKLTYEARVRVSDLIVGWHWNDHRTSVLPIHIVNTQENTIRVATTARNTHEARASKGIVLIWASDKIHVLTWVDLLHPRASYRYKRLENDSFEIVWDISNLTFFEDSTVQGEQLEIELQRELQMLHLNDDLISDSGSIYDGVLGSDSSRDPLSHLGAPPLEPGLCFASAGCGQTIPVESKKIWFERSYLEEMFLSALASLDDDELRQSIQQHSILYGTEQAQTCAMVIDIIRRVDSLLSFRETIILLSRANMEVSSVILSQAQKHKPELQGNESDEQQPYTLNCGKGFAKDQQNKDDMQGTHIQKKYLCTETGCEKSFSRADHVKDHVRRVHRQEKDICPQCGVAYAGKQSLREHIKNIHDRGFANKQHYEDHMQNMRNMRMIQGRYPCTETGCEKTFTRVDHVKGHVRRVHRQEKDLCPRCGKAYASKQHVRKHIEDAHGRGELLYGVGLGL